MKKKLLVLIMALTCLGLAACGSKDSKKQNTSENTEKEQDEEPDEEEEEEAEPLELDELDTDMTLHGLNFKYSSEWTLKEGEDGETFSFYPENTDLFQVVTKGLYGFAEISGAEREEAFDVLKKSIVDGFDDAEVLDESEDKIDGNELIYINLEADLSGRKIVHTYLVAFGDYFTTFSLVHGTDVEADYKPFIDAVLESVTFGEPEYMSTEISFDTPFEFDDFEITFGSDIAWHKLENRFSDLNGADVFSVPITLTNLTSETSKLNMFYFTQFGPSGTKLDTVSSYFNKEDVSFGTEMRGGASLESRMFILFDGYGDYYIEFSKPGSDTIEVKIPVTE